MEPSPYKNAAVTLPTTFKLPLTDTLSAKLAMPVTSKTPPIEADVATSRRPLTDTSFLNSVFEFI